MFGFLKDYIADWPQSGWAVVSAYAALAAVLPFRTLDTKTITRRDTANQPKPAAQQLQHWNEIANMPSGAINSVSATLEVLADDVATLEVSSAVEPAILEAVVVKAAASKLRIHRAKPGLRGQPLRAFRQSPRRAKTAKATQKRTKYKPRSTAARAQRKVPVTRIIMPKARLSSSNVVSFQVARAHAAVAPRLKRAA